MLTWPPADLLNFPLPHGLRLNLSALATPQFATSYQLGAFGNVDGSVAYLYSSVPLNGVVAQSDRVPLLPLLRSYRHLNNLELDREQHSTADIRDTGTSSGNIQGPPRRYDGTLLYGCMYLPRSTLQARVIRRFTPRLQVQVSAVSSEDLRNGGTILGSAHYDKGIYNVEGLASTDGGLLGLRGLYNFGGDASPAPIPPAGAPEETGNGVASERERIYGRFSVGGELYYGTLNKSAGMSVGGRFATLPAYSGTPLAATVTINPLMGNISATYAVLGGEYCTLATMMDFNVYSYESDWQVGMELWSKRRHGGFLLAAEPEPDSDAPPTPHNDSSTRWKERSFQAKLEWRLDEPEPVETSGQNATGVRPDEYLGVLKARLGQQGRIGLLWEGRIKSLIFGLGAGIDLRRLDQSFQSVGLNIQYSS
jgi:distribution and morphology protein 10